MYVMTSKGVPYSKMFRSLSGVRIVLWMSLI